MKCTLLAVALLLSTAQAQQPAVEQLDFTTARSLPLVRITVGGKQLTLILDTGAERTLIDSKDGVERQQYVNVGRQTLHLSVAYVPLNGLGLDKVHADGVLGQDVLRRFKSVCIDYTIQKIKLEMMQ